jgi:2-keto-4-pentenoate hydratase/2-oxohepta-3-ene-1,7-dioic acid hydratase in catechol pathway
MKAGRYFRNEEKRVFIVNPKNELIDAEIFEHSNNVPTAVRNAAAQACSGDTEFCNALPILEAYLNGDGALLSSAQPISSTARFDSPVRPRTFICVGLNYRDHAVESNMPLPKAPLLFAKTSNTINAHNREVNIPPGSEQLDFEAELAIVISRRCKMVGRAEAMNYVAGFTCGNDVSARDFQFADGQWYRGKSCDGFGPLGPWLVTPSEIGDPQNLRIQLRVNGQIMQDSSTSNLVFDVPALIEYVSALITLEPGDVILTGTPPGVGFSRKPPVYLRKGDRVEVEIERIGVLANTIA